MLGYTELKRSLPGKHRMYQNSLTLRYMQIFYGKRRATKSLRCEEQKHCGFVFLRGKSKICLYGMYGPDFEKMFSITFPVIIQNSVLCKWMAGGTRYCWLCPLGEGRWASEHWDLLFPCMHLWNCLTCNKRVENQAELVILNARRVKVTSCVWIMAVVLNLI